MTRNRVFRYNRAQNGKRVSRRGGLALSSAYKETSEYLSGLESLNNGLDLSQIIQSMIPEYDFKRNMLEQLKLTQDIIDVVPIPIFMKDVDRAFRYCNKAALKILGQDLSGVIGKKADQVLGYDAQKYMETDVMLLSGGGVQKYETTVVRPDGKIRKCILRKTVLIDSEGNPIGIVGTIRDITEDRKKENHITKLLKLKDSMMEITHAIMDNRGEKELFHLILDKGLDVIERADHGTILMRGEDDVFRPVAWRGYDHESISNFELKLEGSFVWRATQGKMKKSVLINDLSQFLTENIPDMADSSSGRYINASLCSPILVEGEVIGLLNLDSTMVGAFDDSDLDLAEYMREQLEIALTRRQLYDKIVYLSRHDEVTGLYNRRFFEEFAERTLKRSRRYDEKFCLAVFDLNGLKQVNDNYGHQCGDEIIKTFAKALRESFRETDILGRYGGDEFVGIFLESDKEFLRSRLKHILEELENRPMTYNGNRVTCSFSYGVASYPADGDSYNKLVSVADKNMYAFKRALKFKYR